MANERIITVCILARNEADNLKELLPTLTWADAVTVIDDDSADSTQQVCEQSGVSYYRHPLQDNYARQRNYALHQINHGWVLFIDADERLDEAAVTVIQDVVKTGDPQVGYALKRTDIFYHKPLNYGEVKDVWLVRLAHHAAGVWTGQVHEVWQVPKVEKLPVTLLHYSHTSTAQLFNAVNRYAKLRADELWSQNQSWNAFEQVYYPPLKFLYTFIGKLGFLDGWRGLVMSLAMSWHSWLVRANAWRHVGAWYLVVPLLLLPLGQLQRLQLTPSIAINLFEIGMAVAIGVGSLTITRWQLRSYIPWFVFTIAIATSVVSGLLQGFSLTGSLYFLRWLLYLAYYLVLDHAVRQKKLNLSITGLLQYIGFTLLAGGLLQYLLLPDTRWLQYQGWDDHYYRLIGTLYDPNFFGLLMVLFGLVIWFTQNRYQKVMFLSVTAVALAATYSRLSWFTALTAGLLIRARLAVLLALAGIILILSLSPQPGGEGVNIWRSYSISSRLQSIRAGWQVFMQYPITGVGFNNYPTINPQFGRFGQPIHATAPDNSFIYILATTGMMGGLAFIYLIFSLYVKHPSPLARLTLLAILMHSLGNNSFFYPWILLWYFLVITDRKIPKSWK